jgi:hypothetical protein
VPIFDISERNAFLDNQYGPSHGAAAPASHDLAMFNGDPMFGGVEITGPGYARVTIPNDATWAAAVDGMKSTSASFPAPTGAWDEATHWGLYNGTALGFTDSFDTPLDVTGASPSGPLVQITIYFADDAGA